MLIGAIASGLGQQKDWNTVVATLASSSTLSARKHRGPIRPAPTQRQRQSGRRRANFKVGGAVALFGLAAFAALGFLLSGAPVSHGPLPPQTTDRNWDVVGTITLAPSGAFCRQLAFDNNTGSISDLGWVRCIEAGADRQAAAGQTTAGAFADVRRSFANR